MSARLLGEVAQWILTPAAEPLGAAERCILFVVAERAHDETRQMWRHRGDDMSLYDRILLSTGLGERGLRMAFQKLADVGAEVRVQIGVDKHGKPVFSHRGRSMDFRLPELPASVELPESRNRGAAFLGAEDGPEAAAERPGDGAATVESRNQSAAFEPKAGTRVPPNGQKGGSTVPPHPSKNIPSTTNPSDLVDLSSGAEVEGRLAQVVILKTGEKFDQGEYQTAQAQLLTRPDFGADLVAQAQAEQPDARREIHVINAIRLANSTRRSRSPTRARRGDGHDPPPRPADNVAFAERRSA